MLNDNFFISLQYLQPDIALFKNKSIKPWTYELEDKLSQIPIQFSETEKSAIDVDDTVWIQ